MRPEIDTMETQSTMPATAEALEKIPALSISMYQMEITAAQIRQYFAPKDATTADIAFFMAMAKSLNLNPWKKELHMVPFYDQTGARNYAPVVGYEVYLSRAEASGKLDGWETKFDDDNNPTKCTITIWRDWSHPFTHTTYMDEVMKTKKNGAPMATWATQPRFMLKKCTIAQGMRMCFPECASLPYTFEEQVSIQQDPAQVIIPDADVPVIESAQIEQGLDQMRRDYFDVLDKAIKGNDALRHRWQKRVTGKESVKDWGEPEFIAANIAIQWGDYVELADMAKEKERMETELGKDDAPGQQVDEAGLEAMVTQYADRMGVDVATFGNWTTKAYNTPGSALSILVESLDDEAKSEDIRRRFGKWLDGKGEANTALDAAMNGEADLPM